VTNLKQENLLKTVGEFVYDYFPRFQVAREGLAWVLGAIGLTLMFARFAAKLKVLKPARNLSVVATAFLYYFYRDPSRNPLSNDPNYLYAPADGNLSNFDLIDEPSFIKAKAYRFVITGSLLDVHVLRMPKNGQLRYTYFEKDSLYLGFVGEDNLKFLLAVQLVGGLPRTDTKPLSLRVETGEKVDTGQKLGFSAFGKATRVTLYLELKPDFAQLVQRNQPIRAGTTILGRIHWA
jgi:phosphatidylserine decarboxylase